MKILLVRPPIPHHTIGLKHVMICEPLELEYVAAGLNDHEVQIMDMILEKGFEKRLRRFDPDIVCSSSYISGVNEVIKLFRKVKSWKMHCLTVVGGVQAAQVPEDFADSSVDIIVRGDGTTTMPKLVEALENSGSVFDIPGLAIPSAAGQVELTKESPYMPPADDLPLPRRDLVEHLKHRYYYLMHRPLATIKTTWGCWYKCNFCYTWRITDGDVYSRSPENIVEELENLDASEVYIVDDIFLIKPSRLKRLANLIREKGIKKHYLVYARADFIAQNESIIKEWAELGLRAVFIGLEAATDSELISMDKECTVDYNREAIAVLQRHQIDTYGSLIPDPDYLPEDWERLWQFIESTGLYYINISPLTPLPGTLAAKNYVNQLSVPREAHGLWDLSHVVLKTKMPLKAYYRSLLRLYARTILNTSRAQKHTQRTLPSIWSANYFKLYSGALKIGWQLYHAHRHHSPKEIKKAMDRGPKVAGLDFQTKFNRPLFAYTKSRESHARETVP